MKAKFFFITIFATADAFLGAFAVGFNSRHALIGDPTIPPPKIEKVVPAPTVPAAAKATDKKNAGNEEAKSDPSKEKAAAAKKGKQPHSKGKNDKATQTKDNKAQAKGKKSNTAGKEKASKKPDAKTSKP